MTMDWGDGSYEETARQLAPVADVAVELAAVTGGERVLDVGCGSGNAALAAARRGAAVTGIDPSERLLESARERAAAEQVRATFAAGDAAEPGVPDASFDAALAVFSIIFAPDPEAAVRGVARALRPGGRMVITTWNPAGPIHDSARILREAMNPGGGPGQASPWADPDSLRALLSPHVAEVTVVEKTLPFEAPSPEAWFDSMEANHPFWRAARAAFESRPDAYADLRARCIGVLRDGNESADAFRSTSRYYAVRADLPG